jgi:hypothetical protein
VVAAGAPDRALLRRPVALGHDGKVPPDGIQPDRPAVHRLPPAAPPGHDPCLGTLEGVTSACCGHGGVVQGYREFSDGDELSLHCAPEGLR